MKTIPVFYSPRLVAFGDSFSPSARKPAEVVASWQAQGFPIELLSPEPATVREMSLAHDPEYVRAVLTRQTENGFGNCDDDVAESLPYTNGSLLTAARYAVKRGGVAVAPVAGFHHARYDYGAGFCTFNGIMVTALALKEAGQVRRIGILDCDMHYGDGTASIIHRMHAQEWIVHYTNSKGYSGSAESLFRALPGMLKSMATCDLLIYQAGADPHIDDPLGGYLTTEQLKERDSLVFETVKNMGVPMVWDLAGGYQMERLADGTESISKVLEIHDNTMQECVRHFVSPIKMTRWKRSPTKK